MTAISVIVPLFNCERYVAQAVESVLRQECDSLELIVVNDGSTDRSVESLGPYRDRIRLVDQPHSGVAAARNLGMQMARGRFVAFLDADDWWYPSRLAAQLAAADRFRDAGLIFSDFSVVDEAGSVQIERGLRPWYGVFRDASSTAWSDVYSRSSVLRYTTPDGSVGEAEGFAGNVGTWLYSGNFINTSSVLLRRACIEGAGQFDLSLSTEEDYDYWLRIAGKWELAFVDAVLVARRRRPGQLTEPAQLEVVVRNAMAVVERSSGRMQPPITPEHARSRRSQLHQTLGVICLRSGRNAEARSQLWQSVKLERGSLQSWALLALAAIPFNVLGLLQRLIRRIRAPGKVEVQPGD